MSEEFTGPTRQQIADRIVMKPVAPLDDAWLKEAMQLIADIEVPINSVRCDDLRDHLRARPAVEPAAPEPVAQEPRVLYANASALEWLATKGPNAAVQGFLRNAPDKGCSTPLYTRVVDAARKAVKREK